VSRRDAILDSEAPRLPETTTRTSRNAALVGSIAAWTWTIVAGLGGLCYLIAQGPAKPTNGWFALFSGVAACPLTAVLVKRLAGIEVTGLARFTAAAAIFLLGRIALILGF
jgi:hypothetical protein